MSESTNAKVVLVAVVIEEDSTITVNNKRLSCRVLIDMDLLGISLALIVGTLNNNN